MSLPDTLVRNPMISTWLQFDDETVLLCTGKVELGQGVATALAMVVAEELDVDPVRIRVQTCRTDTGPREFPTVGSLSMLMSSPAVRQVSAEARYRLLRQAAQRFDLPVEALSVTDGLIQNLEGNEQVSYWELLDGQQIDIEVTGEVAAKPVDGYRIVGSSIPRVDLAGKLRGDPAFIQDMSLPGLKHSRVVRPPHYEQVLDEVDVASVEGQPGLHRLIVDGSFVAIVADSEESAERLKKRIRISWRDIPPLETDIETFLRDNVGHRLLVEEGTPTPSAVPESGIAPGEGLRATYYKPYHLHASMAPSAALACYDDEHLTVYSHTQGPALIRLSLAEALALDRSQVTVIHRENAGCYGHNGADDAAMDAALIAMHCPGVPVLLKWDRTDEHQHEPLSPAMVVDLAATVHGNAIMRWEADVFSQVHSNRPFPAADGSTTFLAALQKESPRLKRVPQPAMAHHAGVHRNADPYYKLPARRITKNLVSDTRIRTSSTRALGAFANIFAIESFMDELARSAEVDPVQFRLAHLSDERAVSVVSAVDAGLKRSPLDPGPGWLSGRGLAFARYKNTQCYAAVGVVLVVNEETFDIRLQHAVIAADAGQIIDRDGIANQLEGGFIQAASWTLKEAVPISEQGSLAVDWDSYPILRFDEVPTVDVELIDHPDLPSLGAGEATTGPTPAAIANAVFDATGLRLRRLPINADGLRQVALRLE